jgi:DNA repair protein RadD
MELRKYQREAIDSIYEYFRSDDGNPLIVLPTGTGKSVVLAKFLQESLGTWRDTRVIVLTHVKELIQQNFNAALRAWPEAPAGIYSAGLGKREMDSQILFAGIQSIHRRAYEVQKCDLVMIDEAHLMQKSDNGMYRNFLRDLKDINPDLKIIGLTATPYRMDQGMLTSGVDALFTDICYEADMLDMIEQGYLVPLIPKQTSMTLDVTGVHTRGGEFIAGELERAVDTEEANVAAVAEMIKHGQDRGSWLVFCAGVSHAKHVRDLIKAVGLTCETVSGDTPAPERDRILREFKEGNIRCITNMNVLTTGFDAPGVDMIGMLRPTKSQGLYVQMLGRGTRLANGKDDCLVLDFAGNTRRHGPVDTVRGSKKKDDNEEPGEAPVKVCPKCAMICAAGTLRCKNCGFEFPPREIKISKVASTDALLSSQINNEWVEVDKVTYAAHFKPGKPPSMCVTYQCGLIQYREWICFEHVGYAGEKAVKWWINRTMETAPVPRDTNEAVKRSAFLEVPKKIRVRPNGKYTEIMGYMLP